MGWHETHKPRFFMSSIYDEICDVCGIADAHGQRLQAAPCGAAYSPHESQDHPVSVVYILSLYYDHEGYSHPMGVWTSFPYKAAITKILRQNCGDNCGLTDHQYEVLLINREIPTTSDQWENELHTFSLELNT